MHDDFNLDKHFKTLDRIRKITIFLIFIGWGVFFAFWGGIIALVVYIVTSPGFQKLLGY